MAKPQRWLAYLCQGRSLPFLAHFFIACLADFLLAMIAARPGVYVGFRRGMDLVYPNDVDV